MMRHCLVQELTTLMVFCCLSVASSSTAWLNNSDKKRVRVEVCESRKNYKLHSRIIRINNGLRCVQWLTFICLRPFGHVKIKFHLLTFNIFIEKCVILNSHILHYSFNAYIASIPAFVYYLYSGIW
jgi:hypothetical protein